MEVLLRDHDVISMMLEFLHSRKLFEVAISLERTTGIRSPVEESLPEDLQYLRTLSVDGEWDNVLFFLEPFEELEFNTDGLKYLVLKQKYVEILLGMHRNKTCTADEKDQLIKTLKEIHSYCPAEELKRMKALDKSLFDENESLLASRVRCFKNIVDVLAPFYESYYGPDDKGVVGGFGTHWIHQKADAQSEFTRLESVLTDSIILNECCRYCRERASINQRNRGDTTRNLADAELLLTSQNLNKFDYDLESNAGLMYWIDSLQNDDLFRQQYQIVGNIQLKVEPINQQKISSPLTERESPRKYSSFASPKKPPEMKYGSPSVTRSMQLQQSSEKGRTNHNRLASSVPSQHKISRNYANNNNNNNNKDFGTMANREVPPEYEVATTTINPQTTLQQHIDANQGIQNDIPQLQHTQTEKPKTPIQSRQIPNRENISAQPQVITPVVSETPLRDSSNLPGAEPQMKVDDSYDKFLLEKKKQKDEHQKFLDKLNEKEKKNEEIRQLLLQQQIENSGAVADHNVHHEVQPSQPQANQSTRIQENVPQPKQISGIQENVKSSPKREIHHAPKKISYVPVEYTEDIQAIRAIEFHPSGQVYAVGSNSKTLRLCTVPRDLISNYSSTSPRSLKKLEEIKARSPRSSHVLAKRTDYHRGSIYCMGWNAEGSLIATGSNDKLIKTLGFDILGKTLNESPQEMSFHRGIVREVEFLRQSNNMLASAGADGMVFILDCIYKKQIHSLAGHTNNVLSLCSWDPGKLATASQDETIRLWDVRTPSCVSIIGTSGQDSCYPTSICVNNSGKYIAVGLNNSKVGVYDRTAGKMAIEYKCHNDEVRCVRFNPVFDNQLLSSSYDGNVVLTDLNQLMSEMDPNQSHERHWNVVAGCKNKIIQCKWHPNGEAFGTTSVDKTCRLWLKVLA